MDPESHGSFVVYNLHSVSQDFSGQSESPATGLLARVAAIRREECGPRPTRRRPCAVCLVFPFIRGRVNFGGCIIRRIFRADAFPLVA